MWTIKCRRERGAMLIVASLFLIPLIGLMALAVDLGHILIVRNELQNAADAARSRSESARLPQVAPPDKKPGAAQPDCDLGDIAEAYESENDVN